MADKHVAYNLREPYLSTHFRLANLELLHVLEGVVARALLKIHKLVLCCLDLSGVPFPSCILRIAQFAGILSNFAIRR